MKHSNAVNRLNRLPVSSFHRITIIAVAIAYFFEFADINTFSAIAPKLIKVWGITVNSIAYVTSVSFLGMFIGSNIGSWIADRWGRKKALLLTILWYSCFSLLTAFSWDVWSLGMFRTITSAGLAAMTVVAVIYVNEIYPAAFRGKFQAYALVIGICGTPVTSLIASAVVPLTDWSWRLVFLWGSLGLGSLFLIKSLVESPRWYEYRHEYEKADAILTEIEAKVAKEKGPLPAPEPLIIEEVIDNKPPLAALLEKKYFGPVLVLTILWITQSIGFFGYSSWAPTLLAKEGFSPEKSIFFVALTTIGAPLGSFLASVVTDRYERKWCIVIFGSIIGVSGLLYGLTFNPIMIVVFGFVVNLFERGFTALAYAYSPELFDTKMRSLGTGISYGLGRLSNVVGPLVIAYLYNGHGYQSVFFFIAGVWFLGAMVLAFFGPKTKQSIGRTTSSTAGSTAEISSPQVLSTEK